MKAEDYLSAGRCPNCGKVLSQFDTYYHCYQCNSTWERYQSMGWGDIVWGKVDGWHPPTEEEINEHFEHYTSYSKFRETITENIPLIVISTKRKNE